MYNPFSLKGKTILVTGASSGIGRGIAIECSKMGANIILCARNEERLRETFDRLDDENHAVYSLDLTVESEIENLVSRLPQIDGIVHSAGVSNINPVKRINFSNSTQVLLINTLSAMTLNSSLLRSKKINKGASIIHISSISGTNVGNTGEGLYSASKGAINGYIKSAAVELAKPKIRINAINPGIVETELLEVSHSMFSQEETNMLVAKYPLKRFGKPEDIAYASIYLLSDASTWVTGTSITIDGGFTLL